MSELVLITSGGTKEPVDKVRYIMNRSHGTFGSQIAWELLGESSPNNPHYTSHRPDILFLTADWAVTPFTVTGNRAKESVEVIEARMRRIFGFYNRVGHRYEEVVYKDFADYARKLEEIIRTRKPNVTLLAAAVSDYLCANYVDGKIRSGDDLTIALKHAPKLIGKVKEWCPETRLVGFKLLVDSEDSQLIDAANRSVEDNDCEFVVANDLRDILNNDHRLLICDRSGVQEHKINHDDWNYLGRVVAQRTLELL